MSDALFLVGGTSAADEKAKKERLERMFRAHHELVWRTLRRLGLGPEQAADATQQAFLIAAERLDDIRQGSERAFLFGTALRLARTAYRTGRRWQLEDDMDHRADAGSRLEDLVDRRRAVEVADKVLAQMDPTLLTVFVLFEIEGSRRRKSRSSWACRSEPPLRGSGVLVKHSVPRRRGSSGGRSGRR